MAKHSAIAVLLLVAAVNCDVEKCVVYNFDSGVVGFDNAGTVCDTFPHWYVGSYSEIDVAQPDESDSFIYTIPTIGCSSSFTFKVSAGVVEADIYLSSASSNEGITGMIMMKTDSGDDPVVSNTVLYGMEGWNTISMEISSFHGEFEGYVVFIGTTVQDSTLLLIDSFRFIPSSLTRADCLVAQEDDVTESTEVTTEIPEITETPEVTENTNVTDIPVVTEPNVEEEEHNSEEIEGSGGDQGITEPEIDSEEGSGEIQLQLESEVEEVDIIPDSAEETEEIEEPESLDRCVTYNFEENFDLQFTHDNYFCSGFLTWQLGNYTTEAIEGPNADSHTFISPSNESSCIASTVFHMSPNGRVEATVYMYDVTSLDHIIVMVQRLRDNNNDAVVGFNMYYPANTEFVEGWNVVDFTITDFESFYGYIILFGSGTEGSRVLVDSMRYLPPNFSDSDEECALY